MVKNVCCFWIWLFFRHQYQQINSWLTWARTSTQKRPVSQWEVSAYSRRYRWGQPELQRRTGQNRRNFSLCGDIDKQGANAKVQLFLVDNMFSKTPRHCMCEQGSMTGHGIPKGHFYHSKAYATLLRIPVSNLHVYVWNACLFPSDARILKADSQFPRV